MKWTKERIIEEINKYEYLSDFKKNTQGCHRAAVNMGLHDELNQLKKQRKTHTVEEIQQVISKYNRFNDFTENEPNIYMFCLRNNLNHLFEHLDKRKYWTIEQLENLINQYTTLKEFKTEQPKAYDTIRKRHKHLLTKLNKYVK